MVAVAIIWSAIITASVAILLAFVLLEGEIPDRWAKYLPAKSPAIARDLTSARGRYKRLRHAMVKG